MGLENEYAFHVTGPRGGAVNRLRALSGAQRDRPPGVVVPAEPQRQRHLPVQRRAALHRHRRRTRNGVRRSRPIPGTWCGTSPRANRFCWAWPRSCFAGASWGRPRSTRRTWITRVPAPPGAAHENYMHLAEPAKLPNDLIPFLASRLIITGAGGFDPTAAANCRFTLSPRAFHITTSVATSSTGGRGIYHTKDEPLCSGGHRRLHVLVGESLCSQTANWLKFATTGLAVALAEAGLQPGHDVTLSSPVEALRLYASDPTCRITAPTAGGGRVSALEIQRHYLNLARRHATAPFMPPWSGARSTNGMRFSSGCKMPPTASPPAWIGPSNAVFMARESKNAASHGRCWTIGTS